MLRSPATWLLLDLLLRLLLWLCLLRGWVVRLPAENFIEGQRWRLREELEDLEEELAEVELAAPVRVVLPRGPIRDEVVLNPVVLLDVVEQLDNLRVLGLVQVDVGRHNRILRRQQELETNWPHLRLELDRKLASELDDVVLWLSGEADGDDTGLDRIVTLQKGVHVSSQLRHELVGRALVEQFHLSIMIHFRLKTFCKFLLFGFLSIFG